ncbi:MAG: type II secretion system protein GspM [Desulfurispora sp.]|uniref:type II secretion system protein GspM n=1 Tax=Desulfurispora sp. TaxID=3014275 RepID=UPI00404AB1BA
MAANVSLKKLLLILCFFLAAAAFYYFQLAPLRQHLQELQQQVEQKKAQLSALRSRTARANQAQQELQQARLDWQNTSGVLQTRMDDGLFLVQFGQQLRQQQVQLNKLTPGAILDLNFMLCLPLSLEMQGLYPHVLEIINYLENASNLTSLSQLSFMAVSSPQSNQSQENQALPAAPAVPDGTVTCTGTLYIYTARTPEGRLQLEEISRFLTGRANPFAPTAGTIRENASSRGTPPSQPPTETQLPPEGLLVPPPG